VGPEVVAEAVRVLDAVAARWGHRWSYDEVAIGGAALDAYGEPLRDEDIGRCRSADALLLGAVGGPIWDGVEREKRPERGLLKIRKALGLFANLRPVSVLPSLVDASPLKPELLQGVDLLVVRELTGGIYFGRPSRQWREWRGRVAVDTLVYREHEIRRVVRLAFELAEGRNGRLASVDKANVLQSSRLWRTIVEEVAEEFPAVVWEHVLIDCDGDALDPMARPLRRCRHREHVRRHPDRRSVGRRRVDRALAVGEPRSDRSARSTTRLVRADPRQRARHRRSGRCEPGWRNPLCRDAPPIVACAG
jgi:3-isopropylmalate dehydrogenase